MSLTQTHLQAVDLNVLASYDESQIDGEPDLVVELIDLYLDQAPRLLASIREALDTNDRAAARQLAHSLRGSSANLGVLQMATLANELEFFDANDETLAKALARRLEIEYHRAKEILLAERERRS